MARSEQESYAQNRARVAELEQRKTRIRELNDTLRRFQSNGRVMLTRGVVALGDANVQAVVLAVARFDAFTSESDPHEEHDFGALDVVGQRVFWKIDYYDKRLEFGSPDPADPDVTARVLTIMLAEEY